MYKGQRVAVLIPAYNEEVKIGPTVRRVDRRLVDACFVIDNGSTDATPTVAREAGATVLPFDDVRGVGAALRHGLNYVRNEGFDIAVIMAGNNKDEPAEIPRLLDPICEDAHDLVIGSRYIAGGSFGGDMPMYRRVATRLHPWLTGRFLGKQLTETTNGFRAIRLGVLDDPRIHLEQRWLDGYGLEVYLLFKMIQLGYRHTEVPCTKIYPPRALGYTKMKPVLDWWNILSPVLLLGFAIRR